LNLLSKHQTEDVPENGISVSNFRKNQYDLIKYFIELSVNYLSKQNDDYLKIDKILISKTQEYISVNNNNLTQIVVNVINTKHSLTEVKTLFKIYIPTLIDDSFFILNGNYYVPTLYIIDKPIIMKKNSIKLTSLFNSITIYDRLITFIGANIPASHFLNLLLSDNNQEELNLKNKLINFFNIQTIPILDNELYKYFHNIFGCDETKEKIINYIETIFFDGYTKLLYQYCYNLNENEITMVNILKMSIKERSQMKITDFINLNYKRLIFLEALLIPLFKRIGYYATQTARGFQVDMIKMDQMELIKHFHINLHSKFIYDSVNAYSGMLQHKVNMLNPGSENAPSIIADLHETHFQKICPISISNQNPGETIYITPTTKLDYFGQFI